MPQEIKAIVRPNGSLLLTEQISLKGDRRAILVILDEEPTNDDLWASFAAETEAEEQEALVAMSRLSGKALAAEYPDDDFSDWPTYPKPGRRDDD